MTEPTPTAGKRKKWRWIVGGVVAVLVIGAIAGGGDEEPENVTAGTAASATTAAPATEPPAPTQPPVTKPKKHNDSRLACDHFRNVAGDVSSGILTDAELRKKLKEVNDDAIIATPEVQAAATAMLRAMTQRDGDALGAAVVEMDDACTAAGH